MELSRVAPELRGPMRRVTRIPIPTDSAWGRRVVQTLLAVMPGSKVEGVSIEPLRSADVSLRLYRPAVRRYPAALLLDPRGRADYRSRRPG